jgi:hypothetical protein
MGEAGEDRTGEAVAHLQSAARELIAAVRAFLDVAEEVVEDPKAGEALLDTLGDVARRVVPRSSPDDDDGGVEHIAVD